ncbi:SCO family protein [Neisseriaceae bacterium ESL0693]|nr:SCO family protein [Neisseriaceae bacterium ESL0693]
MYRFKLFSILGTLIGLCACQPQASHSDTPASAAVASTEAAHKLMFEGSDVQQAGLGGSDFTLLNGQGQPVKLSDFKGKVVALVFGYTHCPDVCPTTLLTYAEALQQLGEKARDVQVLFITVDPARDTTTVMENYATAFNPDFIGLTIDPAHMDALNAVLKQYQINVRKTAGTSARDYLIDHSTGTYLLNRQGQVVVYEPHSQSATQLSHDMKQLLN